MVDERDVIFALLQALVFVQLLHLRAVNFKNAKVVAFLFLTLMVLPLIREEGAIYSSGIFLYILYRLQVSKRALTLLTVSFCAVAFFASVKMLHTNKLRYSLMSPALILANSEGGKEDHAAIEAVQAGVKGQVKDVNLNIDNSNAFARAREISIANWELIPEKTDVWDFNIGALKLIMDNPLLYLKIRAVFFKDTVYDAIFGLKEYKTKLEQVAVHTHGQEFFDKNLRPLLPHDESFNLWTRIDESINDFKNNYFVFALFATAAFGLVLLALCLVFYKRVEIAILATGCFAVQSAIAFFLAPESRGKYLFSVLFAGLFVFVILTGEIRQSSAKQNSKDV
jgi:hypothetical protein